jgi:RING-variant domain
MTSKLSHTLNKSFKMAQTLKKKFIKSPQKMISSNSESNNKSNDKSNDIDINPKCRYCWEDIDIKRDIESILSPCACQGTQRFIHIHCFRKWNRNKCELCLFYTIPDINYNNVSNDLNHRYLHNNDDDDWYNNNYYDNDNNDNNNDNIIELNIILKYILIGFFVFHNVCVTLKILILLRDFPFCDIIVDIILLVMINSIFCLELIHVYSIIFN